MVTPGVGLLKKEKILSSFLVNVLVEAAVNEPLSMGFWIKAVWTAINRKKKSVNSLILILLHFKLQMI
jgi:hypothetical protein